MRIESDDTIRLRVPRRSARPGGRWYWIGGAAIAILLAGGGGWWALRPAAPPPAAAFIPPPVPPAPAAFIPPPVPPAPAAFIPPPVPPAPAAFIPPQLPLPVPPPVHSPPAAAPQQTAFAPPRPVPAPAPPALAPPVPPAPRPAPRFALRVATEAEILADHPDRLAIYRFAPVPAVIVLQFPSLAEQALMLNRVAALVEKGGYPRDRVMNRDAMNARIVAGGDTPDDFYYGHDYRAADLVRFFRLAKDLDPQEQTLQALIQQLGWDQKGAVGALVTLVRQTADPALDERARAAILQHELSHGVYFSDSAYAAYCTRFWFDQLTEDERAKFTAFLGREGYDTALTDLMVNETQAYLMHTPDARFFNAAAVGLSQRRVAELRQIFLLGMSPGWLRDNTAVDKLP